MQLHPRPSICRGPAIVPISVAFLYPFLSFCVHTLPWISFTEIKPIIKESKSVISNNRHDLKDVPIVNIIAFLKEIKFFNKI